MVKQPEPSKGKMFYSYEKARKSDSCTCEISVCRRAAAGGVMEGSTLQQSPLTTGSHIPRPPVGA